MHSLRASRALARCTQPRLAATRFVAQARPGMHAATSASASSQPSTSGERAPRGTHTAWCTQQHTHSSSSRQAGSEPGPAWSTHARCASARAPRAVLATQPAVTCTRVHTGPTWSIRMLYDGDCPLCMREVGVRSGRLRPAGSARVWCCGPQQHPVRGLLKVQSHPAAAMDATATGGLPARAGCQQRRDQLR